MGLASLVQDSLVRERGYDLGTGISRGEAVM